MSLFRNEVLIKQRDTLSGSINIFVPVRWRIITYFIFVSLLVALLFISMATYSRVQLVDGALTPDKGVVTILPARAGTIREIDVTDGADVAAGTVLATIRAEEDPAGPSTSGRIDDAILRQSTSLSAQIAAIGSGAAAQRQQIAVLRTGLMAEIGQIRSQIELQGELVASAEDDIKRIKTIATRGFISGRDLQLREDALVSRRQQLSQLRQSLASKEGEFAQAERNSAQLEAQTDAQTAGVAAARAQIDQQAASAQGGRAFVLRAPVAGRVTALTARAGQPAAPQSPLMSIVPAGSRLQAQLSVPSSAIGFVKPGMEVRLAVDAFPYARFGTISGTVVTVAATAVAQPSSSGTTTPSYPVTVSLSRNWVLAYGRREPLVSGMQVTARIVTERQSLMRWMFDPLFAMGRR